MQVVFIKAVVEVMSLDAEEVDYLAEGCTDLIPRYIYTLSSAKSKAAYRANLIH